MFSDKYQDWNQKRIKGIIDFYSFKFFYFKKVLDLGCGYADISASLLRLGADITVLDARQEHLKIVNKKYPEIKTIKADLDKSWPLQGKKYDLVLNLDLLCHISNYEAHLRNVCASATHLVIETSVCDSEDPYKVVMIAENKNNYDSSFNGNGSRPTVAAIERILKESGMNFKRMDNSKFNSGSYKYDWVAKNNNECNSNNRRIWFAVKNDNPVQIAKTRIERPIIHDVITTNQNVQNTQVVLPYTADSNKKFVIIIPTYNTNTWCEKNIQSALNQNYNNYRIIFVDDCSSDGTFNKVKNIVESHRNKNKVTLSRNSQRKGALHNIYDMVHSCSDEEIIVSLDGDDWLSDDEVLNKLNSYYSNNDIWISYGQYRNSTDGGRGVANEYPAHVINNNSFRQYQWGASHLRAFYSWLFKKIKKEDLMHNGSFMSMTWDLAMMLPMLEMAGNHSKYISDILYVYNMSNPISDHRKDRKLQASLDVKIRGMQKYSRVEAPVFRKPTIGLMFIATGKYDQFVQGVISSADNFFLKDYDVKYFIFTDKDLNIATRRKFELIKIEHKKFPFASMDRFKHFTNNSAKLNTDYLYYCDVDSLFVDHVGEEILSSRVATQHCGFVNKKGTFEENKESSSYIDPSKRETYFGGGSSGGTREEYLKLSQWCYFALEKDLEKNIIPCYHDESIINKYFSDNPPTKILSPSYHYPQSNIEYYKKMWAPQTFKPIIMLLDKDHAKIRS